MARTTFREDNELLPEVYAAATHRANRFAVVLLAVIGLFFVTFLSWANWATLDEVTRGSGKVIPSRQIQVVQNLEGGIVQAILVREGDIVEAQQVLLRIDNSLVQGDYKEKRARYLGLLAMAARLKTEADGADSVKYPKEVTAEAASAGTAETALFDSRRAGLKSETYILQRQVDQRRQRVLELRSSIRRLEVQYRSLHEELRLTEPLVGQGAVSRVEYLRLERETNNVKGELETTRLAIPRAQSALAEAQRKVEEKTLSFRTEARKQLNQVRTEIAVLSEAGTAALDRVRRTEVRSPVRGTVKQINVATIGGVIKPGEELVQIVPLDDTLLIEAKIRPADVAFLHPGQKAMVKISAYDFSIYGGLEGTVVGISADTIKDDDPKVTEEYYRIRVRTKENHLGTDENPLPIIPGMTASVDILTGKKSVLDYLLKPILKAKTEALRER